MADGQALLAVLEKETDVAKLKTVVDDIQDRLEPLLLLGEQAKAEAVRPIARLHGQLITSMVKAIGSWLNPNGAHSRERLVLLGEAACLALNALDCLRPVIKASLHDLEVQRYNVVRKLAALGLHQQAMAQGKVLHASTASGPGSASGPGDLHIAAVANLLVCYSELVQVDGADANALWSEVHGPLCGLLSLAREASDVDEAAKRLEPILKCLSKVVETLRIVPVVRKMSPTAAGQQLGAFVACGVFCRQGELVRQVVMDAATDGAVVVHQGLVEALLQHLTSEGSLPDSLCALLHQAGIGLLQKHAVLAVTPQEGHAAEHPAAMAVRAALRIPACMSSQRSSPHLATVLSMLAKSAEVLQLQSRNDTSPGSTRLRWCCLDVLRVAINSIQTQLANAPQSAGGKLPALVDCMECLCLDSLRLLEYGTGTLPSVAVLQSGSSAAVINARLQAAHCLSTGQLAGLHDGMSRALGLLQQLLNWAQQMPDSGCNGGLGALVLQSLSASCGNIGLDLQQAQHLPAAVELFKASAELAFRRVRPLSGGLIASSGADVSQLVKKCKAHVAALQQLSDHAAAMSASASYVAQLHMVTCGDVRLASSLVKLYVRSCLAGASAAAAGVPPAPAQPLVTVSQAPSTAAPAAPCKAPRRVGRPRRMQAADTPDEAQQPSSNPAADSTAMAMKVGAAKQTALSLVPETLVQALASVAASRTELSGILDVLDMYAVQELETIAEEGKALPEAAAAQQEYTNAVLGVLARCADASMDRPYLRARALLVRALTANADLVSQLNDLRNSLTLLDPHWAAERQQSSAHLSKAFGKLDLADSAALAHAHMGLCLAQDQLSEPAGASRTEFLGHVARAVALWAHMLAAYEHANDGLVLRMPNAALHAALQLQQLVLLYGDAHPELHGRCGQTLSRFVSSLSGQVKLREQHIYLLCAARPVASCAAWALAAEPCATLSEAVAGVQRNAKLAEALKTIAPIRATYESNSTDHMAVARAADACATELEYSGFLRHGPGTRLLRSQCHHVASAAYLRAGDTVSAHVQAQEAMRITCALFTTLECQVQGLKGKQGASLSVGKPPAVQSVLTPAEAAAAAVKSGAVASAQDYTVEDDKGPDEFSSNNTQPTKAIDGLNTAPVASPELGSRSNLSSGFAWAVAAAHLASLHQTARVFEAAGCAEDATCLWKECGRVADLFGVTAMKAVCSNYLAELSCRCGDGTAAQAHIEAAAAAVSAMEQCSADGQARSSMASLLGSHLCAVQSRMALAREEPTSVQDFCDRGVAACDRALSGSASWNQLSCSSAHWSRDTPSGLAWHFVCLRSHLQRLRAEAMVRIGRKAEAARQLQDAEGQLQQTAAACAGRSAPAVWPVDYGLLLAHRTSATLEPAGRSCSGDNAIVVGLGSCQSSPREPHQGPDPSDICNDGKPRTDQSNRRGTKPKGNGAHSKASAKECGVPGEISTGAELPASSWMCAVPAFAQSLLLCWEVPLAAVYACQQLLRGCIALGLPHAASMFLHLGQGMSYPQQQAVQQQLRQRNARKPPPSASIGSNVGNVTEEAPTAPSGDVRSFAKRLLCEITTAGSSDGSILAAMEQGAEAWFRQVLSKLPPGAVIASLTQDHRDDQVLLGRIVPGAAPLLVSLPKPGRPDTADSASKALDDCAAKLERLLQESGDSMQIDQDAAPLQGQKTKWWKMRTTIDQGVQDLLQELEGRCLGPWRCLFLPMPSHHRDRLRAAALAFKDEHLPAVDAGLPDGSRRSTVNEHVLLELLTVTLAHMQQLKAPELSSLLQAACVQLGQPADSSQLAALALELAAAEAAVRVELLSLPGEATAACDSTSGSSRATAASDSGPAGRSVATAPSKAAGTATARSSRACTAAPGSRTCAQPQTGMTASRQTIAASGRRAGVAMLPDDENAPAKAAAGTGASGRSTRAPRLAALQSHTSSIGGPTGAPKTTAHAAGSKTAIRNDAAPASTSTSGVPAAPAKNCGGPVLITLSPALHALPWESVPCCQGLEFYRILSLPVACAAATTDTAPAFCHQAGVHSDRVPFDSDSASSSDQGTVSAQSPPSAYYVLNPGGDLIDTQRFLQPLLEAVPNWQGLIGARPDVKTLQSALQSHELFLYFGHGSGEQFLPLPALRKLQCCAMSLLMGCSSGRLRLHGAYDPSGSAVAYLVAGCPALVANLWDVTDRDIDRYCQALMQSWLGCGVADRTPEPSSSGAGESQDPTEKTMGIAVARSRGVCKLKYLTGAAPVCYGLPTGRQS